MLRARVGLSSPRERLLHAVIDELYGATRNDGTDDGFRIQGIAGRQGVGPSHKLAEELFVDLALNDDSASIETDLALMKEGPERRGADRIVHIDVVENDHRIETAKFHHGPLQKAPGTFRQHPCGLDSADQIDDPDLSAMAPSASGA